MTDFVEMFRHWNAGRSQVQINEALNIDRKTIRNYLAPALAEGAGCAPVERRRGDQQRLAAGTPGGASRRGERDLPAQAVVAELADRIVVDEAVLARDLELVEREVALVLEPVGLRAGRQDSPRPPGPCTPCETPTPCRRHSSGRC